MNIIRTISGHETFTDAAKTGIAEGSAMLEKAVTGIVKGILGSEGRPTRKRTLPSILRGTSWDVGPLLKKSASAEKVTPEDLSSSELSPVVKARSPSPEVSEEEVTKFNPDSFDVNFPLFDYS